MSSSFALLAAVVLFTVTAPAPAQTSWGNALYFNHTGLVNAAIPTLANNYTFSAWVYLTWGGNTWSSSALGVLSAYCGQSAEVMVSSQTLSSTDPQYLWFTRCGSFSAAYSTLTVPLNEWVHIAVTVSPSGLVSYFINGNAAGSWNAGGYNVSIGPGITLADSVHRSFYGMLDEVQIWNTARTQAQIAADMTHPLTGAEPNLVACYHFDEGAGTTVHDATANHLDGTMTTGPVWVASTVDTNPPVITCPTNQVVVAAPGECGTNVTFAATATDNLDPAPTVTCVPPSGFAFPVGRTTVLCTAADTSGNSNTCSFTVSVYPAVTNLPTILGATNQVLEAAGPTGAPASFNVTATNLCQPNVPVTCTPPSGSTFPLGTNTVTCVAVDALGVTNSASFTLTVRDTTPPVLTCPTNQEVLAAPGVCEATVTFTATATDSVDPAPTVTCVPPSGFAFPVGRTTVLCTATDASGNSNTCTFTVSVYPTWAPAGEVWTARASNRSWRSVASSADGTRLVAVVSGGQIYASTDGGTNWAATSAPSTNWNSVASSADGTRLVAVVGGGQIYTSTDSGTNWTARESERGWWSVASSADGTRLVAVVSGGQIYTSTDAGTNWAATSAPGAAWGSVASSADGTRLVAGVDGGQIYTSTDAGETWIARTPEGDDRRWFSIASSADGNRLVAVYPARMGSAGLIYTSTDAGTNWTARMTDTTRYWLCVASSADGTRLVAGVSGGQIYTSTDAGETWTARMTDANRQWYSVASSADGTRLVAVEYGGQIYTSVPTVVPFAGPPTILDATNRVIEATGPSGATLIVTATNLCQPNVPVTCNPPSGSTLPLGTHWVTCVAVDAFGATSSASFFVTVRDTTPPVLTCPNLVVVAAPGQCEAVVTFTATATDTVDPAPTVTCEPPSGWAFPVGRTPVRCTATDAYGGNTSTCSFTVSVYPYGRLAPAGEIWTARASNRDWISVASSADGTRLAAVAHGGQIYTSTDSGTNWATTSAPSANWYSVASSADGTRLVAVDGLGTGSGGQIYTSTDSGMNWTARESKRKWNSVASSADGTRLVAVVYGGQIFTSTDSGANWTARMTDTTRYWLCVASSADGTRLVAGVSGGQIYTSTDAGETWTARENDRGWSCIASSADGTHLVAADSYGTGSGGRIYTSTDAGATWTARERNRMWLSVASSADGTRLVAVVLFGKIYTSVPTPVPLADPPTIVGATNQVIEATGPGGAVAAFNVTATNVCQPDVPVTCNPPSGSTFPLGTNAVTCVAVDALGVTNTASFTVAVLLPAQPVFAGCTVPAPGQFQLQATGTAGVTYTLQTSTNLVDWLDHTNILASPTGLIECVEEMDPGAPACFYRLKWP